MTAMTLSLQLLVTMKCIKRRQEAAAHVLVDPSTRNLTQNIFIFKLKIKGMQRMVFLVCYKNFIVK